MRNDFLVGVVVLLNWIDLELSKVNFGDQRLSSRLLQLMRSFSSFFQGSIPDACAVSARIKAAYRFFANKKVTMESIHQAHLKNLVDRVSQHKLVLNIQDTTKLNYYHHKSKKDRGHIGTGFKSRQSLGYWFHGGIVVDTKGVPLGISSAKVWTRAANTANEEEIALSPKKSESCKWIDGKDSCKPLLANGTEIIQIADREADFFNFLNECKKDNFSFLVRVSGNRVITSTMAKDSEKEILGNFMDRQPISCTRKLTIEGNSNRKGTQVQVDIRVASIVLASPTSRINKIDETLQRKMQVNAILVTSRAKINGNEIRWLLLTDRDIAGDKDINNLVGYYALRWHIEIFFKVLKSGCNVEDCRLSTLRKISTYLIMQSIIAIRVMTLTYCGQHLPETPITSVFPRAEWDKIKRIIYHSSERIPANVKINNAARKIAEFGGFINKTKRRPGVTTTWRGWQRIQIILDGIERLSYAV